jgi:hypothetical protein
MKKLILQSLAIIAVNIVVGALTILAFFALIFRGDPILAAIPALMALPGILLQPWFVLFIFTDGLIIAPIQTSVISVPLYFVLERMGKLNRAKRVVARLKNRKAVAVIAGIVLCMLAVGFARYVDFPALRHGVPGTSALKHSLKDMDLALGSSRYYCLGSFIDSEWLWQVSLSEQDMHLLADKMSMHPMPADQVGEAFRNMPPYWWQPAISDQTHVMATAKFPMEGRGSDGWHAMATWNPEDNVLHMWIKDNF